MCIRDRYGEEQSMKPTEEKIQSNASDLPVYLFKQGNNCEAYRYFDAHMETRAGEAGVVFRVWACLLYTSRCV